MEDHLSLMIFVSTILLMRLAPPAMLGFNQASQIPMDSSWHHYYGPPLTWNNLAQDPSNRNVFCGKLHTDLYGLTSQANPSEKITVFITYDKAILKDEIVARIRSKVEETQLIFASNFIPVLILKLPIGEIPILENVDGVKYIFADQKVRLYYDRLAQKSFPDLQRETSKYPRLYLNESSMIIRANKLWDIGIDGKGVYLAVIDSGVNWTHPDLAGKIVFSTSFVPYEDPMDYLGHGTHVAGIVAGTGAASNGKFRGIAPGAYIVNIKAFDKNGTADLSWILQALEALLMMRTINIVLMCWGTPPLPESHPLNLYMAELAMCNIIPVAAAGNQAYYWTVGSPANSPYVISVGASTKEDRLAFFTSKGPDLYTTRALPSLVAPGVGVIAPISGSLAQYSLSENPSYAQLSGTSMAAAHVAGAAALLLSAFPSASLNAIKAALLLSADDIGYDANAMGAGRLNVYKAYEILSLGRTFTVFHPKAITGFEAPFVACFPGDIDFFNITIFTSTSLTNARLTVTGNASKIFSIKRYELGFIEGLTSVGANITIPANASTGLYVGSLELWNASALMDYMPIKIKVAKPVATIYWDDMHDFLLGYQFLWRWYITYWQTVSAAGIRLVSASLSGIELTIRQPTIRFNAILLMDPYWGFTDKDIQTLINYVRCGGNLFVIYGQRADMTKLDEVLREFGITIVNLRVKYGYPVYSNAAMILKPEHPAVAGVRNFTVFMGWVALEPSGKAIPLARVRDKVYYETLYRQGYPVPVDFTVIAAYEHAPYTGRLLVIGNDYMFDDVWINTWWHVELPYLIIDYAKTPGNSVLARTAALWVMGDVTPPKVIITSPLDGTFLKGVSTIKVSAEDDQSGISEVTFHVNGKPSYRDTEMPYEFKWNTTGLHDGVYTIEAVAYDRAGNKNSTSITIIIDNTKPILSIVDPKGWAFVRGFLTVNFSVFDANLLSVAYSIDGGPLISITNERSFTINTLKLTDGMHNITITALDRAGNMVTESKAIIVDNTRPTALINAPWNGSHLKNVIFINITGVDVNFKAMDLFISGMLAQTWSTAGTKAYSWDTRAYKDGQYKITLTVYDMAGNTASANVWVTVDNTAPVIMFMEPLEGAYLRGVCKITVYGWDANMHLMELYVDEILIKAWTVAGLQTLTWDTRGVVDGNHKIKLVCRDMAGNVVEKAITITVDNTPPVASINAPLDGAQLSGINQIEFNASDENLDRILLYIDYAVFDVTGKTRYIWDTATIGDGNHTVKIVAVDKAGNTATAQITVITINVQKAALESYEMGKEEGYISGGKMGIVIGVLIGLTIGILTVYTMSKRRRH